MSGARTPMGGWKTPMLGGVLLRAIRFIFNIGLAAARGTVLGLKLDKMSDSVAGQTVVDPQGYLTDLVRQSEYFRRSEILRRLGYC